MSPSIIIKGGFMMTNAMLSWATEQFGYAYQSYFYGFGYFACVKLNGMPVVKRDC
jgi:hypothetical protein